jgi:type IV pilus assembly protein PilQ
VVLGGVYEQNKINTVSRVPYFGDLPYVGFLFKNKTIRVAKTIVKVF